MNADQKPQTDELKSTATQVILMIAGWIGLWVVFLAFRCGDKPGGRGFHVRLAVALGATLGGSKLQKLLGKG